MMLRLPLLQPCEVASKNQTGAILCTYESLSFSLMHTGSLMMIVLAMIMLRFLSGTASLSSFMKLALATMPSSVKKTTGMFTKGNVSACPIVRSSLASVPANSDVQFASYLILSRDQH